MTAAQLRKVKSGDILRCAIDSRVFLAFAGRMDKRDGENGMTIEPIRDIGSPVSFRWLSGKHIELHYARVTP